ncbi:c-type cytochrome [Aquibaculum arenosum]|uniref:Cytochrome c n=1 Tax=Aquibaculum arenosum TaxID=3032591 RepID=A0ABT5YQR0_9PROT|nr:cytochrome c [Fodinicurvata sp. CAU 1616]MDF2097158.1 cytochrome c [Fodinicurvata sp. CAU 1616]
MGQVETGRELAQSYCAGCHAVGEQDSSPLPEAPAFRDLHHRYPVAHLAESLAEGIAVGHPAMPEFVLEPGEVEAFIRYLESLEE